MSSAHQDQNPTEDQIEDQEAVNETETSVEDNQEINTEEEVVVEEVSELETLQAQNTELKDKYLRLMAEFDNFRKRTARQRNEERATAAIGTMNSILPVVDDFDRAKQIADSPDAEDNFSNGVELVYQKFKRTLSQLGLEEMTSTGETFDAEKHEAFTEIPAPSPEMVGKVVDTIEKGYYLNQKLIRHAKVVVGK